MMRKKRMEVEGFTVIRKQNNPYKHEALFTVVYEFDLSDQGRPIDMVVLVDDGIEVARAREKYHDKLAAIESVLKARYDALERDYINTVTTVAKAMKDPIPSQEEMVWQFSRKPDAQELSELLKLATERYNNADRNKRV